MRSPSNIKTTRKELLKHLPSLNPGKTLLDAIRARNPELSEHTIVGLACAHLITERKMYLRGRCEALMASPLVPEYQKEIVAIQLSIMELI